jgi:hypothetical protein
MGKTLNIMVNTTENGVNESTNHHDASTHRHKKNIVLTLQWEDNIDSQDIYE